VKPGSGPERHLNRSFETQARSLCFSQFQEIPFHSAGERNISSVPLFALEGFEAVTALPNGINDVSALRRVTFQPCGE